MAAADYPALLDDIASRRLDLRAMIAPGEPLGLEEAGAASWRWVRRRRAASCSSTPPADLPRHNGLMTSVRRWWDEQALPRLVDVALADATSGTWRTTVCVGATGEVLEIGFGSGRNLPYYGDTVTRVLAVEPADLAWARAKARVTASGMPVTRVGLDGADLPVPDASVDTVVSTWTLCTVPGVERALHEARRVLRPGGQLRFVEHSAAPSRRVAGIQRRIQPLWGRVAGGCHVDRDIAGLLRGAGYDVELTYEGFVSGGVATPWSWFVTGSATPR
jgi:ubiquinone/menaquinone biosynthesis C-methylase UbiE